MHKMKQKQIHRNKKQADYGQRGGGWEMGEH